MILYRSSLLLMVILGCFIPKQVVLMHLWLPALCLGIIGVIVVVLDPREPLQPADPLSSMSKDEEKK